MNEQHANQNAQSTASDGSGFYKTELGKKEMEAIGPRQLAAGVSQDHEPKKPSFAVALSGGGIRSATFCLGVFQALARNGLLPRIDYLSTVSGGGYLGGFLGRMFCRPWVKDHLNQPSQPNTSSDFRDRSAVPPALSSPLPTNPKPWDWVTAVLESPQCSPIKWLRDNGRYLSPNGSGDTWMAVASVLRNWVAVQVVMTTLVLLVFLTINVIRAGYWYLANPNPPCFEGRLLALTKNHSMWWSPSIGLALIPLLLGVVPLGWAFWLTQGQERGQGRCRWIQPWFVALLLVAFCVAGCFCPRLSTYQIAFGIVAFCGIVAFFLWTSVGGMKQLDLSALRKSRTSLTSRLAGALGLTLGLAAFGFVDSLGQTLYAIGSVNFKSIGAKAAGAAVGASVIMSAAKQILLLSEKLPKGKAFKLPLDILAAIAAAFLLVVSLTALSALSHAIAWDFKTPRPRRA